MINEERDVTDDADPFEGWERPPPADLDVERRFVELFKQRRMARGMSQAQAASIVRELYGLSMDPTGITRLEGGDRRLRLNEALALALAVGADLASMVGEVMAPDFRRQILLAEKERLMDVSGGVDQELREVSEQLAALEKPSGA
jgi:transcriptional regulator with XRE-family HTH domain